MKLAIAFGVVLLMLAAPAETPSKSITEIIDSSGDGTNLDFHGKGLT